MSQIERTTTGQFSKWKLFRELQAHGYQLHKVTKPRAHPKYLAIKKPNGHSIQLGKVGKGGRPNWLTMWKVFQKNVQEQ